MLPVSLTFSDAVRQSSTCPAAARYCSERIAEDVGYLNSAKWTPPELVRHYHEFFGHWPKKGEPAFGRTRSSIFADLDRAERQAHAAFERETVVGRLDGRDVTIADLRRAFEQVHVPGDWKAPFFAVVSVDDAEVFAESVRFFQGDDPRFSGVGLPAGMLRMTSRGYQG